MRFGKFSFGVIFVSFIPMLLGIFFIYFLPQETAVVVDLKPEMVPEAVEEAPPLVEVRQPNLDSPSAIKAVYFTSSSGGSRSRINYLLELASSTEINAVIIDIKDFSGKLAYETAVPEAKEYGAGSFKIDDVQSLIRELHENGIYVIGRITIFQDPVLALARPDLAVQSQSRTASFTLSTSTASTVWLDSFGLAWVDPAAKEAWAYNLAIAKEAASLGFDELNFDYVRFPSDGDLKDMDFLFWDRTTPRHSVIREFFKYLRQGLPETKISVDLFGLSTVAADDLGIGHIIEDGFEYFDYVSPMVYPSHYATGFQEFENPAEHPYEVIKFSLENALKRLLVFNQSTGKIAKLRPWLQDFSIRGVEYDEEMVKAEIRAVRDSLGENFQGFMLWSPTNIYTKEALGSSVLGQNGI